MNTFLGGLHCDRHGQLHTSVVSQNLAHNNNDVAVAPFLVLEHGPAQEAIPQMRPVKKDKDYVIEKLKAELDLKVSLR